MDAAGAGCRQPAIAVHGRPFEPHGGTVGGSGVRDVPRRHGAANKPRGTGARTELAGILVDCAASAGSHPSDRYWKRARTALRRLSSKRTCRAGSWKNVRALASGANQARRGRDIRIVALGAHPVRGKGRAHPSKSKAKVTNLLSA